MTGDWIMAGVIDHRARVTGWRVRRLRLSCVGSHFASTQAPDLQRCWSFEDKGSSSDNGVMDPAENEILYGWFALGCVVFERENGCVRRQ